MTPLQKLGQQFFGLAFVSFGCGLVSRHDFLDMQGWFECASVLTGIAAFACIVMAIVSVGSKA